MMDVSRLNEAERMVIIEAMTYYETQQRRIVRRSLDEDSVADAKWRRYVADELRTSIISR